MGTFSTPGEAIPRIFEKSIFVRFLGENDPRLKSKVLGQGNLAPEAGGTGGKFRGNRPRHGAIHAL